MVTESEELEEFRQQLADEVAYNHASGSFPEEGFGYVMTDYLRTGEVIPELSVRSLNANGPRGKRMEILGFGLDEADGALNVLIGTYMNPPYQVLPKTEIDTVMSSGVAFVENSLNGWIEENLEPSSPEAEDAFALKELAANAKSIKFRLITNRIKSDRVKTIPNQKINGISTSFDIWDLQRTFELIHSASGRENFSIDVTDWLEDGLLALVGDSGTDLAGDTYLATVPGNMLADIFDNFGSQLLEQNVRTFLSTRGKINKGIQKTISDSPERFLAYNNGITATATSINVGKDEIDGDGNHTSSLAHIFQIDNLQIVNGGQTTSSLSYFRRNGKAKDKEENLRNIKVQMKLVLVQEEALDAESLVSNVARYANSQNKVNEADLASNSKYHIQLESLSKKIAAPAEESKQYQSYWFYERARGQWENQRSALSASKKTQFDLKFPKNQKIDKTSWAKYQSTWEQYPHIVSKGAQANFLEFSKHMYNRWQADSSFVDEEYFKTGVAKAILFEKTRLAILNSAWYEPGYLANVVTYTVSKLAHQIEQQFPGKELDFKKIWLRQNISDELAEATSSIGYLVRQVLTDDNRPQKNVTQYAKTETCWKKVQEAFVVLPSSLVNDLTDNASTTDKSDDERDATERVLSVEKPVYQEILKSLSARNLIDSSENLLLMRTVLHYSGMVSPTTSEAQKILELLTRASDNGLIERDSF